MNSNSGFCNKVITIPQYEATCWFNAILMTILYSQHSRKLLMNDNTLLNKNTKIAKIINYILKNQYISNIYAEQYFNLMTPGKILKYFGLFNEFREFITNKGWFSESFLPIFITNACYKTCISFDLYQNNIYIEFMKKIRFVHNINKIHNDEYMMIYDDKITNDELCQYIKSKLNEPNPDYILLTIRDDSDISKIYLKYLNKSLPFIESKINLKYYDIKTSGLKELHDIITYNGDTYILDSCIISNYNEYINNSAHAITGITCKNEKYVYNGWIRSTKDPAMMIGKNIKNNSNQSKTKLLPCELMKFNWKPNERNSSFCINFNKCKLDKIKTKDDSNEKKNLCFSFGKNERTVIYVKQLKGTIKSFDKNTINSDIELTLPTVSSSTPNIFADIKKTPNKKKELLVKVKDDFKLNIKLKKLKVLKQTLENEIILLKKIIEKIENKIFK